MTNIFLWLLLCRVAIATQNDLIEDHLIPVSNYTQSGQSELSEQSEEGSGKEVPLIPITGNLGQFMQRVVIEGSGEDPYIHEQLFKETFTTEKILFDEGSGEEASQTTETKETETETTAETEIIEIPTKIPVALKISPVEGKETVLEASVIENFPQKIGIYIIVVMLGLTFLSLVVFLVIRKKVRRKRRREDTEKGLNLNKIVKDDEDNKIKNNEITPLVMNNFEKSGNYSLPKNLNTPNEKNVAKDNNLKTQTILEEEDEKPEKLIVRALIDNDSVPKKPVIVNKNGYSAVPQDPH